MAGLAFCISCIIVVILNIAFLLISLALVALGGVVLGGKDILAEAVKVVKGLLPKGVNIDEVIQEGLKLVSSVAVVLIIVGLIVLAITIIALLGSCCRNKNLLLIYVISIGVVLLGQIILVGVYFGQKPYFEDQAQKYLKKTITDDYRGDNSTNFNSVGWTLINFQFECCGVDNGKDFVQAKNWKNKYMTYRDKKYGPLTYPVSCCKQKDGSFENIEECVKNKNTQYSNHEKGCWNSLDKLVGDNLNIFIYCVAGICGAQLIVILLVVLMICKIKEED